MIILTSEWGDEGQDHGGTSPVPQTCCPRVHYGNATTPVGT